jgi:hypothetical protein
LKLRAVTCTFDIMFEDGSSWECNAYKPHMHNHDSLSGTCGNLDKTFMSSQISYPNRKGT